MRGEDPDSYFQRGSRWGDSARLDFFDSICRSGEKDLFSITRAHFETLAERINASPERTGALVAETASRAREAWARLRGSLPIAPGAREALEKHLKMIAI